MEKNNENQPSQEMNEARKPKRTFEQACKECDAIPLKDFGDRLLQGINNIYKNGKH